jgi:hypothetical protein
VSRGQQICEVAFWALLLGFAPFMTFVEIVASVVKRKRP